MSFQSSIMVLMIKHLRNNKQSASIMICGFIFARTVVMRSTPVATTYHAKIPTDTLYLQIVCQRHAVLNQDRLLIIDCQGEIEQFIRITDNQTDLETKEPSHHTFPSLAKPSNTL